MQHFSDIILPRGEKTTNELESFSFLHLFSPHGIFLVLMSKALRWSWHVPQHLSSLEHSEELWQEILEKAMDDKASEKHKSVHLLPVRSACLC